jgi:hypothetical protein
MNTYLDPTLKSRNYNKMNTDGHGHDGDAVIDDGDDALASKDSDGGEHWFPFASSPSRSLLEVRFQRVLMSMNVRSLIHLHGVKVFDEAVLMVHGMAGWYGRGSAVPMLVKASDASFLDWFSLGCENNCS